MEMRYLIPLFILTGYFQISRELDLDVDKILKSTDVITELNPAWTSKGERIVEGDIVIPNSKDSRETNEIEDRKGIVNVATLWYNGIVPFSYHSSEVFTSLLHIEDETSFAILQKHPENGWKIEPVTSTVDPSTRENIRKAIHHWENITCLRFREVMLDFHYLRFRSDTPGCWSFIGRTIIAPLAPQDVSIGKGCNKVHIIVHEIGHAIGFYHEQSRNDRGDFVIIMWHNMEAGKYSQFDKGLESARGVEYDYISVMHYGSMAFSKKLFEKNTIVSKNPLHQRLVGAGNGLSFRDGKLANILYSCNDGCPNLADESKCQNGGYMSPYRKDKQPCFCVCSPETTGEFCETIVGEYYAKPPCGGQITEETEIQTPGYPERSLDVDDGCSWWIQAPPNMRTQVEFTDFSFYPRFNQSSSPYDGRCVVERVEIRTQDINDGDMFCDEDIPPRTIARSKGRDFIILITNNPTERAGRGLLAKITFVPDKSGEGSSGSSENQLSDLLKSISYR